MVWYISNTMSKTAGFTKKANPIMLQRGLESGSSSAPSIENLKRIYIHLHYKTWKMHLRQNSGVPVDAGDKSDFRGIKSFLSASKGPL